MKRALAVAAALSCGCGYGLHETAKTQLPGTTSLALGASYVTNELDAQRGSSLYHYAPEVGPLRVGLTDHLDVGVAALYGLGLRADVKYNLLPRASPFAIAPRLGGGYAWNGKERRAVVALAGAIASYDFGTVVTPYLGATFVNHWIYGAQPDTSTLAPGEQLAPRAGYGDGLLELVLGVRWHATEVVAFDAELSHWAPVQDDPGDSYKFVANEIVSLGIRICFSPPCE